METQHRSGLLSLARLRPYGPGLALLIMCLGFGLAEPRFATADNAWAIVDRSAIPLILAVGMSFVVLQGSIDLALEGGMAACSLVVALLVLNSRNALDLGAAGVALALLPGLALGVVNGCLVTRLGVPSFMATLGAWSAAQGVAMLLSGGQPPRILDQGLRDFGLGRSGPVPNLALVAAAVVALGAVVQYATRFGRYSMAIGGGEALLRLSGIRVDRYKVAAFALSGCLAGLAGVLASMQIGLGHADIGVGQVLATITAVVIGGTPLSGGRGGVLQSALGVLILSVLADGMIFAGVTPELQKAVQGALTLVASLVGAWPLRTRLGSVA